MRNLTTSLLLVTTILVVGGCESFPGGIIPDVKNLEGVEIYDKHGRMVAGHNCTSRFESGKREGKVCTTVLPDGTKKISYYKFDPGEVE